MYCPGEFAYIVGESCQFLEKWFEIVDFIPFLPLRLVHEQLGDFGKSLLFVCPLDHGLRYRHGVLPVNEKAGRPSTYSWNGPRDLCYGFWGLFSHPTV